MAIVQHAIRYRWVILGLALLSQFSSSLAGQLLAPLAPLFQPDLGLTKAEVGLFASATFTGSWCMQLAGGSLTDRFGVRWTTSVGLTVAGILLLAVAGTSTAVQAAAVMFAVGVARGTVFPAATKAIMEWFPPGIRATAMGLKQTGMPIAGVVTGAAIPALGLALGWRSAIAVTGFGVIAGGIAIGALYRDPSAPERGLRTGGFMRAGLRSVAGNRALWTLSGICLLFQIPQMALLTYLALYFKDVVLVPLVPDESARVVAAGGYLALCQAGGLVARVCWGLVSDRAFHGRRMAVMAVAGGFSTLVLLAMGQLEPGSPQWLLAGVVFVSGACVSGWNGVYQALVGETVGRKYAATGVGFSATLSELGTLFGPPLFGLVVDAAGSYRTGWHLLAALSLAGAMTAIRAARRERHGE